MSENHIAELALQLSALNGLVAQLSRDIGDLKEFRASIESQFGGDEDPNVDLEGNPIRVR